MTTCKREISEISRLHYIKLLVRSALFLAGLVAYLANLGINQTAETARSLGKGIVAGLAWVLLMVEMISRFFPNKRESMGCQKQFARSYREKNGTGGKRKPGIDGSVVAVAVAWVALNGAIGGLYYGRVIDEDILWLICLAYSVCDMICILFFCPFQTWFMKNKCCTTCRIYNWDFAMMFTPMIFVKGFFGWSLLVCALLLLLRWEITYYRHPEWFSEDSNASLSCANCQEKLCQHKKQLRSFHRALKAAGK